MRKINVSWQYFLSCILFFSLLAGSVGLPAAPALADHTADPASVTIAGSLQSELGCPGDWDPACAASHLAYDTADDVWQAVFDLPAGFYEYKAALNDSWDENYGLNAQPNGANIPLSLGAPTSIKFYYDHKTHWVTDSINSVIAAVPGSFQSELGCAGDWDPGCLRSWLQDPDGDGTYMFSTTAIPAGDYEAKVAIDESWAENYGAGGVPGGANIPFSVPVDGYRVAFIYDTVSHILSISVTAPLPTYTVALVGSLQDELGCPGDWQPDCVATELVYDANDDVWQQTFSLPAGSFEFKVALNDTWDENYGAGGAPGGANISLTLSAPANVKFYYDHKSHWITSNFNAVIATVPGSFQSEMGCAGDWDPGCLRSWLQDLDGDGIYTFQTEALPAGSYEAKVAINESWDENYGAGGAPGGANIGFNVPVDNALVSFSYDSVTHILTITVVGSGGASHDNDVWWNDLGHNSRDPLFRTPTGPVNAGAAVTVRLRAASGDLTEAKVRIWNDRINAQSLLNMSLVADDGVYEWWEAALPVSADPTIYWYRFIAIDGTATAFYEDDGARDGGWGETYASSPDNGWQLTMYDPAFYTPEWVKNGVMYQIFPERFRNGDPSNDPQPGRFFYGELNGTIYRSDPTGGTSNPWNTPVCDPRDAADCPGTYSLNFYGGDLQGVIDQLDYLQNLGVTILYFNPIFESPSNHKYDTTDYGVISRDFGDLATFDALVTAANSRGMNIVLDGVFNHTSSDSIYFDRYSRFDAAGNETSAVPGVNDGSGACEGPTSPYRDWYYFTDVTPGTGPCAGSDGTPASATYESWFGFDSLPKLNAQTPEVRDLIFTGGPQSVALYWLAEGAGGWRFDVGGDVDPGLTNDPNNDYWESFRSTTRALNPDSYMVIEEWGNASPWLLGGEMDATMNYQYSSAMLSFWRDTTFTDNDHNSGSSAGELAPLAPSQLDARLKNWIERYPPEAMYAMMNLLGSHDTNRALFMLDENAATGTDATPLLDASYDWNPALTRLKGVALLQMTLPGAPTIYYGDEVGLVGPTYYYGGKWEDDPYNRQPFPWLDESGTPFYTHLQSGGAGWTDLLPYYQALTAARNSHAALRTGSFDTLLVDDAAKVYAYGRLLADYSDAAVVVVNRSNAAQAVTVDVSGYLPVGASFTDVLGGGSYMVNAVGAIVLPAVPGMSGALLVTDAPMPMPPAAVTDLAAAAAGSDSVSLSWSPAAGADSYDVYRSLVSGGGYTLLANVTGSSYSDSGLSVATDYYYVVVSLDDTTLLASANSNEASATPAYTIGWANLQWPPSINHTISAINRTENIYGQIWIDGVTSQPGATPGLLAQVGFGATGTAPSDSWTWEPMTFNTDTGFNNSNDEYMGSLLPDQLGTFCYTTRYSGDGGVTWFYAVNGPDESNPTCPGPFGVLTVVAGADITPPAAPTGLSIAGTTNSSISLSWDIHPDTDGDLYGFEVYRENVSAPGFSRIDTIADPAATTYTDDSVTTGATYNYYLVAFDNSYNRSAASNSVQATAEPRLVSVTFRIGVPAYTPGTVYIAGNIPEFGPWNPGLVPMTQVNAATWEYTLDILDGAALQFKFTRGSWDTVESWGSIVSLNNRSVTINYGASGVQLVDMTATDWGNGPDSTKAVEYWRDPLVVDHSPADGATFVPVDTTVSVVWSIPMQPDTDFLVEGPSGVVAGSFAYDDLTKIVTFTPSANLAKGATYVVTVSGAISVGVPGGDSGVQQAPYVFSFTTVPNQPPALSVDAPIVTVAEGQTAVNSGAVSDADSSNLTLSASAGAVTDNGDGTWSWSLATTDGPADSGLVTITADDGDDTSQVSFSLVVDNVAPSIASLVVPLEPVSIDNLAAYSVDVTFNDPAGAYDAPYMCYFDFDNNGTVDSTAAGVSGAACSSPLSYSEPGIYTVKVTVSDKDGGSSSATSASFVVVYDPDGGFVTGGGWIWSQAGWCRLNAVCAGAEGKANFGFVSRYKRGATLPTGNTEFNFSAGKFNFQSTAYDWLVVNRSGANAQFKGTGTVNGALAANGEPYKFMIWAADGGSSGVDTFRIKIWYEQNGSEVVVYDNGFNQPIGGGNIAVHD